MKPSIYCVGEALIDWIATDGNDLMQAISFKKMLGGAPYNVAIGLARLGATVSFGGSVGEDVFGNALHYLLQQNQVDTSMLQKTEQPTTFAFVSLTNDGERDFLFQRGADQHFNLVSTHPFSVVHFGSATAFLGGDLEKTYNKEWQQAIANQSYLSFDPNYRDALWGNQTDVFIQKCEPFLQQAHLVKLSEEEAMLLTQTNQLSDALQQLEKYQIPIVTITLGKKGTLLVQGKQQQIIPSIAVNAIDTTGAGDAFVAAMLYQVSKQLSKDILWQQWCDMVQFANKIAALSTTKYGALESLPYLNEVE
jgi:fructokinase